MVRPFPIPTRLLLCALVALGASVGSLSPAWAQDEGSMPPMGRPAELDQLAFMVGDWEVAMEMKMGPDAPFTSVPAKATVSSSLDGCVQVMDFHAEIMGMPFHGMDHTTYNRNTGKFESVWVDNMSANFTFMAGGLTDGKFVQTGENMMMGQMVHMRSTAEKRDGGSVYWVMEESYDGGQNWTVTMKMTYTPKK